MLSAILVCYLPILFPPFSLPPDHGQQHVPLPPHDPHLPTPLPPISLFPLVAPHPLLPLPLQTPFHKIMATSTCSTPPQPPLPFPSTPPPIPPIPSPPCPLLLYLPFFLPTINPTFPFNPLPQIMARSIFSRSLPVASLSSSSLHTPYLLSPLSPSLPNPLP